MFEPDRLVSLVPGLSLYRVVLVTSFFIVAYGGFTVAGNAARSYQLAAQRGELQQAIARDQAEYARLDALRRYMRTDAFIESQAREQGLAIAGDTAIVVSAPAPAAPAQTAGQGAWWERYYGR
jgi:cell division protein FtsB